MFRYLISPATPGERVLTPAITIANINDSNYVITAYDIEIDSWARRFRYSFFYCMLFGGNPGTSYIRAQREQSVTTSADLGDPLHHASHLPEDIREKAKDATVDHYHIRHSKPVTPEQLETFLKHRNKYLKSQGFPRANRLSKELINDILDCYKKYLESNSPGTQTYSNNPDYQHALQTKSQKLPSITEHIVCLQAQGALGCDTSKPFPDTTGLISAKENAANTGNAIDITGHLTLYGLLALGLFKMTNYLLAPQDSQNQRTAHRNQSSPSINRKMR